MALELGKTYPLADGSGTGTVVKIGYWVKINGGRHNGEIQHRDANGKYAGVMSQGAPDLVVSQPVEQIVEERADL